MNTGKQAKFKVNTLKQQRENAEMESIIEEFGRAMRNAYRPFVTRPPACQHEHGPRFTPGMEAVWARYVEFCADHL